ncbi:type III polyketide synthase [Kamptonema cortianum]|nr:type III polyketide synthase [Oscillatoria laete-virens]MDK3160280.1 type III polyketide synthase [Kamptonema cortianum]MDL5053665.1 type III polyketide synthase [Oscillatoria laete-virens NRMC-F 0139]
MSLEPHKHFPVVIKGLACEAPALFCSQNRALELAAQFAADGAKPGGVDLARAYYGTRIGKRHFVMITPGTSGDTAQFALYQDGQGRPRPSPSTAERMALYEQEAPPLAVSAATQALAHANCAGGDITHLITVSCTGFDSPGFEFRLIEECGLPPHVGRLHVGFMGCHGAFNALRAAAAFAQIDPAARVLVVSVELCSLHMQYGARPEDVIANALFADGAGACVVGQGMPEGDELSLEGFLSHVIAGTAPQMGWHIRDAGFVMDLKREIPRSIRRHLPGVMRDWLGGQGLDSSGQVGGWGIHPGGPKIVEASLEALGLDSTAADASFHVLHEYGNMSSATIFFILREMLRRKLPRPWVMVGYGPGLSVEAMLAR